MKKIAVLLLLACVLLSSVCASGASSAQAKEITKKCKITSSHGATQKLLDGKLDEYWEARKTDSVITVKLPKNTPASGMLVKWFQRFDRFEFTQYDAGGELIASADSADFFPSYVTWLDIDENAVQVELKVYNSGKICGLHVYSAGSNSSIQQWQNPADKIDLLMIVAHQDDEELWFGGMLPYYAAVRGKNVQLVYMTTCGRKRIDEALNGLWVMGIKTLPEVLGLKNRYPENLDEAYETWNGKDNILRLLVSTIRKYRPEVIVTHDWNGEYGHSQHKATSHLMEEAVKAAADPAMYPESAEEYGVWQTKKLYLHLSDTNTIYMDWSVPAEELNGLSPIQAAELGYKQHKSQQKAYSMDMGKKKYDYTKFGLVFSTVGEDVKKNDLMENTEAE